MKVNIVSLQPYAYLIDKMVSLRSSICFSRISLEEKKFPDSESYYRIINSQELQGLPAVFVCGTISNNAIFDTFNIACGLVSSGCSSLHLVIPYFGYSTMERAEKDGEIVVAKNMTRLMGAIPMPENGIYVYMIDLHSSEIQRYFEKSIRTIHISAQPAIEEMIKNFSRGEQSVIASADMGRAEHIGKLSDKLHLESAFLVKRRISAEKTETMSIDARVSGKVVVIYDDIIRSGASIMGAALAYRTSGAKNVFVVVTHGVFAGSSFKKLRECNLIGGISCTNTHPNVNKISGNDGFLGVYDISNIIVRELEKNLVC